MFENVNQNKAEVQKPIVKSVKIAEVKPVVVSQPVKSAESVLKPAGQGVFFVINRFYPIVLALVVVVIVAGLFWVGYNGYQNKVAGLKLQIEKQKQIIQDKQNELNQKKQN